MRTVRVAMKYPATVQEAESCWYDVARWPDWVDGLDRIVAVSGDWPRAGSTVSWESGSAGRGSVREHVIAREPLFVGRAMAASMSTTLARFGAELASRLQASGTPPRPPLTSNED